VRTLTTRAVVAVLVAGTVAAALVGLLRPLVAVLRAVAPPL